MFGLTLALVAALFLRLAAIAIVFVLGMRAKSPLALSAAMWFTRTVANPP